MTKKIYYPYKITGTEPDALDHAVERKLIQQWQERRLRRSRDRLIKHYLLFTLKTVRKLYGSRMEDDMCLEIAHAAVMDSIDRFTLHREHSRLCNIIPFSIRICFKHWLRGSRIVKCPVKEARGNHDLFPSLDFPRRYQDREDACVSEVALTELGPTTGSAFLQASPDVDLDSLVGFHTDNHDTEQHAKQLDLVRRAVKRLPKTDRDILKGVYFKDRSLASIGRDQGVTRESIRQRRNAILARLRAAIQDDPCFKE